MMRFSAVLRRILLLTLCLMLAAAPALGEGMRFSLQAAVYPEACPRELQSLLQPLALLLDAASVSGTFVTDEGAFSLDASLALTDGNTSGSASVQVYGIGSHWGVRSSLLGETELMVNCASLLPFGQKARDYLGIPLDAAALLVPYTHVDALRSAMTLLAPLFPDAEGKTRISREDLDEIITDLEQLCDSDPALNRYLNVTGLYRTAKYYCRCYHRIPGWLLSSLTIKRDSSSLTWSSGLITILRLQEKNGVFTGEFSLPTLCSASLRAEQNGLLLTGEASVDMDSLQAEIAFSLPARLTNTAADISLKVDAASPILPEDGVHIRISGRTLGNDVTLHLLHHETGSVMLTVSGSLIPVASEPLPDWTPDDFTGFSILSVNSDSLRTLLGEVKWPLLTGAMELLGAAPARSVQLLMDYAEDAGLIDLLTSALDGSGGY